MIIVKNFNNFTSAKSFDDLLSKNGAKTVIVPLWNYKERTYTIRVTANTK